MACSISYLPQCDGRALKSEKRARPILESSSLAGIRLEAADSLECSHASEGKVIHFRLH